jgi:hypothetical protein
MSSYYSLLRHHIDRETLAARAARRRKDSALVWHHLERAHILSQPSARHHTRIHALMIVTALWITDVRELAGQVLRILVAGIGSLLGRYPVGNTGRARVPINQPMPIPVDLQQILDEVEQRHRANTRRESPREPSR